MHKRKYIFIISFLLFILGLIGRGEPNGLLATGTPVIYQITIKYVGVSYDNGASYYPLYNDSTGTTVNFGSDSVSAGQKVYDLSLTADLPEGTINKIKVTLGPYCTFKGSVSYAGPTHYTPTANNVSPDVNLTALVAVGLASYGTITNYYTGSSPSDSTSENSASIEITSATNILKLSINVTNAITLYLYLPGPPPVYIIVLSNPSISFSKGN